MFNRAWRSVLQPAFFALFGLGSLALGLVILLFGWVIPDSDVRKSAFIQRLIHYAFRLFLWMLANLKVMDFRFDGADLLQQGGGGLLIANHPTLLDVVLILSRLPQADCIVKEALWHNVFLRRIVSAAGYIPNINGPELAQEAIERVRQGRKVIIFPEGTRSLPTALRPFSKGFAHIAVRAPCLLWPVILTCQPSALTKGRSAFSIPAKRACLSATAQEPLNPAAFYDPADQAALAAIKVTAAVQRYFEERVNYGPSGKA